MNQSIVNYYRLTLVIRLSHSGQAISTHRLIIPQLLALHEKWFESPASYQWWKIIKSTNIFVFFLTEIQHVNCQSFEILAGNYKSKPDYQLPRCWQFMLPHWGRVTHICVDKLTIIGSENGLSPGWRQAITWTNVGILLNGPLENKSQWNFKRN